MTMADDEFATFFKSPDHRHHTSQIFQPISQDYLGITKKQSVSSIRFIKLIKGDAARNDYKKIPKHLGEHLKYPSRATKRGLGDYETLERPICRSHSGHNGFYLLALSSVPLS